MWTYSLLTLMADPTRASSAASLTAFGSKVSISTLGEQATSGQPPLSGHLQVLDLRHAGWEGLCKNPTSPGAKDNKTGRSHLVTLPTFHR